MTIEELVVEKLRQLPADKQREVLDFVESLEGKAASGQAKSFAEVAKAHIGAVEGGPGDLATNKKYMEGYGKD